MWRSALLRRVGYKEAKMDLIVPYLIVPYIREVESREYLIVP